MRKYWIFVVICASSLYAMDDVLKAQEKLARKAQEELARKAQEGLARAMAEYVLSEEDSEGDSENDSAHEKFCAECEDIAANGFAARCVQHISNPVGSDNILNESK